MFMGKSEPESVVACAIDTYAYSRSLFAVWATALALCASPVAAQSLPDTARTRTASPLFTSADAWLAIGFLTGAAALAPLDFYVAGELQDSSLQANSVLRRLSASARFLGFPGSAILGTSAYLAGRIGDMPRLAAIGLHGTEAIIVSYTVVWAGKNLIGRARPDQDPDDPFNFALGRGFRRGDPFESLPSGHTAAA